MFGRYCYRNEVLGRESTSEEIEFLKNNRHRSNYMQQQSKIRAEPESTKTNITKLKILALHGWRQNGQVFRSKIKPLVKALSDVADIYFVSAPVKYEAQGAALEAINNAYDIAPDFSSQRVWWISSEGNKIYQYFDTNLEYLQHTFQNQGPFDGILGFAQGGTCGAILSTMSDLFNVQFLVLIASYIPRATEFVSKFTPNFLPTPSLHIIGKGDILVVPERSRALAQTFVQAEIIEHDGGHFVPNIWPSNKIRDFITKFTPHASSTTPNKIDWASLILSTTAANVESVASQLASQLKIEFAIGYNCQQLGHTDRFCFDKPDEQNASDLLCPTNCIDAIVGKRHQINRTWGLAKLVASKLFSTTTDTIKQVALFERAIQILRRMRREQMQKYSKVSTKITTAAPTPSETPLSYYVVNPVPEPVEVCTLHELNPLLDFLTNNFPVAEQIAFPRGTITADGRLDLCKQVVGPGGIQPLLNAMNKSSSIKRLLLGNNIVGDGGAECIANEMKVSKLECWYIAGNNITSNGIAHITSAIANNTYCTSLWLKRNPLGPLSMQHVVNMLKINTTLVVIDLVNCGILDEGLSVLLGAFSGENRNNTLRVLWLDTNGITYRSADTLANFISTNCNLTDLSISCNRLCDVGMEKISPALVSNTTLQRISFASNRIGPVGAKCLANSLAYHPTINFVNLGYLKSTAAVQEFGNFIGDEGAGHLATALKTNTTIRHIDLLHNNITQVGLNYIIDAMKINNVVVKMQFTQHKIIHSEPGKEFMEEKLRQNYALLNEEDKERINQVLLPWYIRDIYSVYRTKN
jgi:hypothetical protein